MSDWKNRLEIYDQLISKCARFERLGKTMPYTGANGYMFSLLNKAGEIGIRFSEKQKANCNKKFKTTEYKAYGGDDERLYPDS